MSVILFSADELANVLVCISSNSTNRYGQSLQELAELLALISGANVACFNDKYRASEPRVEAREIVSAVGKITGKGNLSQAVRTTQLLHYNCVDNLDGIEAVEGSGPALMTILKKMMLSCAVAGKVIES